MRYKIKCSSCKHLRDNEYYGCYHCTSSNNHKYYQFSVLSTIYNFLDTSFGLMLGILAIIFLVALTGYFISTMIKAVTIHDVEVPDGVIAGAAWAGYETFTPRQQEIVVIEEPEETIILPEEPEAKKEPAFKLSSSEKEWLYAVVMAEAGNQPIEGIRAACDVVLNRSRDYGSVEAAVKAPHQFSSYSDGGIAKWRSYITQDVIDICDTEISEGVKYSYYFFRTGHYSSYGKDGERIGDHYFSYKKYDSTRR